MSTSSDDTREQTNSYTDVQEEESLLIPKDHQLVERFSFPHSKLERGKFRASKWRFIIIGLIGIANFGSYFCTDMPSSLEREIESTYNIESTEYNLLFSVYSLPCILFTLLLGILIDRTSAFKLTILLGALAVLFGHGLFSFSAHAKHPNFHQALLGRFFLGFGTEGILLAGGVIFGYWLKGKELALGIGISTVCGRLGSISSNWTIPLIYHTSRNNILLCFLVGLALCLIVVIAASIYCLVDHFATQRDGDIRINMGREEERVSLKEAIKLNTSTWLAIGSCTLIYCLILPWIRIAPDCLQQRFGMDMASSARLASLPFIVMSITAPVMGYLFDLIGYRTIGIAFSSFLCILAHVIINLVEKNEFYITMSLIILGAGYGIYLVSIFPTIQYAVNNNVLGLATGLTGSIQNIALTLIPFFLGEIIDKYTIIDQNGRNSQQGYIYISWLLVGIGIIGLFFGLALIMYDWKNGKILHSVNPLITRENIEEQNKVLLREKQYN